MMSNKWPQGNIDLFGYNLAECPWCIDFSNVLQYEHTYVIIANLYWATFYCPTKEPHWMLFWRGV